MRLVVLVVGWWAGCLAERPRPCESPALLTGLLTVNEKLWTVAKYVYDALGQRVRIMELGTYENKSFTYDALLLYSEDTMYEIHQHNRTCKKMPLKADFQPMAVPKDATLVGQFVLGSSSEPGEGLLVNSWTGDLPDKSGPYLSSVTEFGCVPVTSVVHTEQFGWVQIGFLDNVKGIPDPDKLNPPDFCTNAEMDSEEEPTHFLRLFLSKK